MRTTRVLMCPPDFIRIDHEINEHMDKADPPDQKRARLEWESVVKEYFDLGVEPWFIEPDPRYQDMCFPANTGWCRWGKVIMGNFVGKVAQARQGEIHLYKEWFQKYAKALGVEVVDWPRPDLGYGAQADTVTVGSTGKNNTLVLMGYGMKDRTSYESAEILADIHGLAKDQVIPIRLVDPYFYDFDAAHLYILPSDSTPETFICYPPAVDSAGKRIIDSLPIDRQNIIRVGHEDALNFVCNGVFVKKIDGGVAIIMNNPSVNLQAQLRERGFDLRIKYTPELKKNGGSIRCITRFIPYERS